MMAGCRVEESEICYGNLDITSGTLEGGRSGNQWTERLKGLRCAIYGTALLLWPFTDISTNEHSRLDRYTSKLGHVFTLLDVFIGARIAGRGRGRGRGRGWGMDDELGCTVRVPQREKRKCFGNFSRWGMGIGVTVTVSGGC
jgi:hypothetical protein